MQIASCWNRVGTGSVEVSQKQKLNKTIFQNVITLTRIGRKKVTVSRIFLEAMKLIPSRDSMRKELSNRTLSLETF